MKDDLIKGLFGGGAFISLSVWACYIIISVQVLKKFSLHLTSEYIEVVLPFKATIARWEEIASVDTYYSHGNDYVAVLLKSHKEKKSFTRNFESVFGVPSYSFQIPARFFKDVDMNRLLLTISEQINSRLANEGQHVDRITHGKDENNIIGALSTSGLMGLILSVVYGISIWQLEENFVFIPIFGSFLIISMFNTYYKEESFNLMARLYIGFLCLVQIPLGIILATTLETEMYFAIDDIFFVIKKYFKYVVKYPAEQWFSIVIGLICFGIGAIRGRVK
ncbi:hypothetical protein [Anaeromicrobium sediminis]|nr:hypothetical protein [Anaeromicrobium sediminis]